MLHSECSWKRLSTGRDIYSNAADIVRVAWGEGGALFATDGLLAYSFSRWSYLGSMTMTLAFC